MRSLPGGAAAGWAFEARARRRHVLAGRFHIKERGIYTAAVGFRTPQVERGGIALLV